MFAEPIDPSANLDSMEGKLFGIGCESYTVGSHEFYLGYAATRGMRLTLDTGHYHPTETIADKLSAVLAFLPAVVLHVSRGVRWDSDHVVVAGDDVDAIAQELVRGEFLGRTHIGLDYFDASINRVAAWIVGARSVIRALLRAMLEPADQLRELGAGRRLHLTTGAAGGDQAAAVRRCVGALLRDRGGAIRPAVDRGREAVRTDGHGRAPLILGGGLISFSSGHDKNLQRERFASSSLYSRAAAGSRRLMGHGPWAMGHGKNSSSIHVLLTADR